MGMKGTVTYFDIKAAGSIDHAIVENVKRKKSLSDLAFDEIRRAIAGTDDEVL